VLLASQFLYAGIVLGLSILVVHRGTTWIAGAYLLGNLLAGIVTGTAFLFRGAAYRATPVANTESTG
jgi:hypothetical protein